MKVKLQIGPDTSVEVEHDANGKPIAIIFTPLFVSSKAKAVVAYGSAETDSGKMVDLFSLSVSGATGKVSKTGRATSVSAAVDQPVETPTPPVATNKGSKPTLPVSG